MAIHSTVLAWEIPWTDEPDGLQPMGSQELAVTATKPPPFMCICICTYMSLNHFAAQRKLTHYKSTLLQLHKKKGMPCFYQQAFTDWPEERKADRKHVYMCVVIAQIV